VIYTTYVDKDEIIQDGDFVVKEDVPRWIDAIMYETDVVIRIRRVNTEKGLGFVAEVESSKMDFVFPTGAKIDVTGKDNLKKFASLVEKWKGRRAG